MYIVYVYSVIVVVESSPPVERPLTIIMNGHVLLFHSL